MSTFVPASETTNVPIARALADMTAIAESPWILELSLSLEIKKDAKMTIGITTGSGARPRTEAMAKAPKATCDKPSPSIDFLRKTSGVPMSAEERAMNAPATSACTMNEYENIPTKLFMMHLSDKFGSCAKEIISVS